MVFFDPEFCNALNFSFFSTINFAILLGTRVFVQNEIVNEPGAARLYLENGTCIGYTQIPATRTHTKRSRVVLDACKTTVGRGAFRTLHGGTSGGDRG